jgi:hypothetical protein
MEPYVKVPGERVATAAPGSCTRIPWLIGTHIVLAVSPLLGIFIPLDERFLFLIWVVFALPLGGLMALALWIGMGPTRVWWRILAGVVASGYFAIWPFIWEGVQMPADGPGTGLLVGYLMAVVPYAVIIFSMAGMFGLMGGRFKLAHVAECKPPVDDRFRFSVLQILIVMSTVAIILSLLRGVQTEDKGAAHGTFSWPWFAENALGILIYVINTACAAHATLRLGRVKWSIAGVVVVSALFGIVVASSLHQEVMGWWYFFGSTLIIVIPTLVLIATLLVVRSCGIRLVRRMDLLITTAE